MSKDPYQDANAPPPYDYQAVPAPPYGPPQGGMYPQLGPQYAPPPHGAPYVPPHGPQYSVQPPPPTQVVHVSQPVAVTRLLVGPNPIRTQCPSCHANIKTGVSYNSSMKTHVLAIIFCLFCCWPCICLPYCMSSCKDATHTCPNCKAFLGVHRA